MLDVLAIAKDASATVVSGTGSTVARYVVTVTAAGQEAVRTEGTNRVVPVTGLVNGREYQVTVEAFDATGKLVDRGTTILMPAAAAAGGVIAASLDLAGGTPISGTDAVLRRALASATSTGSRWRYDYLRAQAIAAAGDAARLDEQVASLVQLDVAKMTSAGEIFAPYVLGAFDDLSKLASTVKQIPVPDVGDAAARLADAINTVALLQRLLSWLASESVLGFWVGLFGALIDDIAAIQTDLPRTRRHVRKQFDSGSIGTAVVAMLNDARAEILGAVDDLAVPLRAAVGDVVEEVAGGLEAVFESFDDALLVPAGTGAAADPLTQLAAQLLATVDALVARVKAAVTEALANAGSAGAAATLFEVIVATYLVLPILAALVIGIGGGPFAAAALAAAVTLAGQELIHLVTRWLTGPIAAQLDALRGNVAEATQALKDVVGTAVPANLATPATGQKLRMLAGQLGNLGDLVPDELLHEAAALVEAARDVVLRAATDLGLAAEQALGMEHATAFDLVDLEYVTTLPAAPRLPGGTGNGRFAAAAMLRDLGRLDAARTQLLDGKDLVLTQRLSLFELLGGQGTPESPIDPGLFARLLAGEDVVVRLTEENLVDRTHPGLYRVLIADVRVTGVFANAAGVLPVGNIPVHVTHLGPSSTRVRRGANPYAPDLPLVADSGFPHAPGAGEARERSPKWGSAYLAEDRDPRVGSLGFATLVRELPPETSVFNVFPRDSRAQTVAGLAGESVALPFATRDAAQYRPFENRGVEGELLVRLPTAVPAELLSDVPVSLLSGASPLRDLVLEVTLRACYDDDLAAAVRTAQAQRRDVLRVAGAAIAPGVRFARAMPVRATGESERRTVHVSLRAHRDETLRLWQAFLPAYRTQHGGLPTAGASWAAVEKAAPLGRNAAFQPLPMTADPAANQLPAFEIGFAASGAATDQTGAALGGLARRVTLTPEMLGIPADLAAAPGASGGLVGVSVAVVPMGSTATKPAKQLRSPAPAAPPPSFTHASVCALDRGVHVLGKSGSLWESRLAVEDWQPLRDVGDTRPQPHGPFSSVEIDGEVHVCAVAGAKVWYAVRGRDGSWSPWSDVVAAAGTTGAIGDFRAVAVAESDGLLHVVAVAQESAASNVVRFPLLHTVRQRDGSWLRLGDASAYCGRYFTFARSVDATEVSGDLHIVVVDGNNDAYHTIRYRDGSWQPAGHVNPVTGRAAGTLVSASVATVAGEMHLCALTTTGELLHSIRHENSWEPLRSLYGTAMTFSAVDCAGLGPDLHVVTVGTDHRLRHVVRQGDVSWSPTVEVADAARYETVTLDPLAGRLTLAATGRLTAALPGFGTAKTPARLVVGPDRDDPLVGFAELFQGTDKIALGLPRPEDAPFYDVIVSLTYVVPVRVVEAVPS